MKMTPMIPEIQASAMLAEAGVRTAVVAPQPSQNLAPGRSGTPHWRQKSVAASARPGSGAGASVCWGVWESFGSLERSIESPVGTRIPIIVRWPDMLPGYVNPGYLMVRGSLDGCQRHQNRY